MTRKKKLKDVARSLQEEIDCSTSSEKIPGNMAELNLFVGDVAEDVVEDGECPTEDGLKVGGGLMSDGITGEQKSMKWSETGCDKANASKVSDLITEKHELDVKGVAGKMLDRKPSNERTYADILKNSRDPAAGHHLYYDNLATEDVIKILPDEILDVGKSWGYGLVGYFPTRHPGKDGLKKITDS